MPDVVAPQAEPARPALVIPRAPTQPIGARRGVTGGYPIGLLAAVAIVLVIVAGVLSLRGGGLVGGGGTGSSLAGATTFPPVPSFGPTQTAVPEPTSPPKHHGHGHGQSSQ